MKLKLLVSVCVLLGATALGQDKEKQDSVWTVSESPTGISYAHGPCYVYVPADGKSINISATDASGKLRQTLVINWDEAGPHFVETWMVTIGRTQFIVVDDDTDIFQQSCAKAAEQLPKKVLHLFGGRWGIKSP